MVYSIINDFFINQVSSLYRINFGGYVDLLFSCRTRQVRIVYDKGLDGNNATQTTQSLQPLLCMESEKINNKYFLKFDGTKRIISNINLNAVSGKKRYNKCFYCI